MARRYIGSATINIRYRDCGDYAGTISVDGRCVWRFEDLNAPPIGLGEGVAYDSPLAYDKMAAAAASFGSYDVEEVSNATCCDVDDRGDYLVRRSK
jgi:hypothetical protein